MRSRDRTGRLRWRRGDEVIGSSACLMRSALGMIHQGGIYPFDNQRLQIQDEIMRPLFCGTRRCELQRALYQKGLQTAVAGPIDIFNRLPLPLYYQANSCTDNDSLLSHRLTCHFKTVTVTLTAKAVHLRLSQCSALPIGGCQYSWSIWSSDPMSS